jgi:hypothetical protein
MSADAIIIATQVDDLIHAHPMLAEGLLDAAKEAEDNAIHHVKKRVG